MPRRACFPRCQTRNIGSFDFDFFESEVREFVAVDPTCFCCVLTRVCAAVHGRRARWTGASCRDVEAKPARSATSSCLSMGLQLPHRFACAVQHQTRRCCSFAIELLFVAVGWAAGAFTALIAVFIAYCSRSLTHLKFAAMNKFVGGCRAPCAVAVATPTCRYSGCTIIPLCRGCGGCCNVQTRRATSTTASRTWCCW